MSTSETSYTHARLKALGRVIVAVLGTILGLTTVATGIVLTAAPAYAATAPTLANGSAAYDNVTSEPPNTTTTTSTIASPGTATSLAVAGTYGPGSASTNGYTFAPIGDVDITSTCGLDIFSYTTRASITSFTGASLVSGNPSCSIPSGSTVSQLGAPTQYNAMSLVSGGATNVNPSSLYIAAQPPISDGYAQITTTSTTGIITMQPESTATGNFSLTFGYCAPGETYPTGPDCSTATLTYNAGSSTLVGENVSVSISSETIYEAPSSANTSPQYTAKGSNFTFSQDPTTDLIPYENYSSIGTITINYANGFASIEPVPAGMTFVPGSIQQFGGDGVTGGGATTVKYCTAAGTGCDATMSGNYKTTYPYLEEEFSGTHIAGGQMVTLPGFSAQFTASGNPGAAPQNTLTELRVTTNAQVPILGATNVAFDGYPTSCPSYTQTGNTSGCPTSGTPAYVAPTGPPFTTIIPSVTGLDTTTDTTTGGATVNITGTGFTGASAVDFGTNPAVFNVNNDGSITATDPGGSVGTVDVTVVSGGETSATSSADQFTYTLGPPGPSTNVVAEPDNAQAEVTWTAPFNPGDPIESYTVTATDTTTPANGGETCQSATTSCTVTGLTNGDSYTFAVTATSDVGTGPSSASSAPIVLGAPQQPTGVSATGAQNASSTVTWTDPAVTGASPVTQYTVTAADSTTPANGGETCIYTVSNPEADSCNVTGLTNGDSYTFTVTATNGSGTGPASAPSAAVVPSTVPGAPTAVSATSGANAQSVVSFTAPASNGGAAISGYTVTAADSTTPANGGQTASGTASPITVTGLTNGDSYTFSVTATNVSGTGPASAPSASVVPATVPGAPTAVTASSTPVTQTTAATVSWTAPASNGGSALTKYTATSSTGSKTCTATPPATTCNVTGLTNGTSYTFTVTATNAVGTERGVGTVECRRPVDHAQCPHYRHRDIGQRLGVGRLHQPERHRHRRPDHHGLHGDGDGPHHAGQRRPDGHRVRDADRRERPDQRRQLHLHRVRHQRRRQRSELVGLRCGHHRPPRSPDSGRGESGQRRGDGELDGPGIDRWWASHVVHGEAQQRQRDVHVERLASADHLHGDRPDQQDRLHVHGDGHQRLRHRPGVLGVVEHHRGRAHAADQRGRHWGSERPVDGELDHCVQQRVRHHLPDGDLLDGLQDVQPVPGDQHDLHRDRPDQRDHLHVHGEGGQRQRHQPDLGGFEQHRALDGARRPDGCECDPGGEPGRSQLHRPGLQRWRLNHRLHGDSSGQHHACQRRTDGQWQRQPDHSDRAYQR